MSNIMLSMNPFNRKIESFNELFRSIQQCKIAKTCPDRDVRQYYYENESSALNYPILFICESPATRGGFGDGSKREKCWALTDEDHHFRSMLKSVELDGAYITNFVKCGALARCKPTKFNLQMCLPFLLAEIALIKPKIIVCVGKNDKLLRFAKKHLGPNVKIMSIYHYSWSRRKGVYIPEKERASYNEVKCAVDSA